MLNAIFTSACPKILERNMDMGEAQKKYSDKYMVVTNSHVEDGYLHGDILAILTPKEYFEMEVPEPFLPKYVIWAGLNLNGGDLGVVGYYM